MKTLRTIILFVIISLYLTSCTDIITDDDQLVLDTIENTQGTENSDLTGGNGNDGGNGGGKGG